MPYITGTICTLIQLFTLYLFHKYSGSEYNVFLVSLAVVSLWTANIADFKHNKKETKEVTKEVTDKIYKYWDDFKDKE
jgi:hypothetical protein